MDDLGRLDSWQFALVDLDTGDEHILPSADIIKVSGEVVAGVGRQRLRHAELTLAMGTEGNPTRSAQVLTWTGWQLLRIIPGQDTGEEFWGLVVKQDAHFGNVLGNETVRLVVPGIEKLLGSRIVESGGGPIVSGGATGDDYAKALVRACVAGNDPSGNSRAWTWGTLNVAADTSACAATDADHEEHGQLLDEVLARLADEYEFVYQLSVTFAAGAFVFDFETEPWPGGTDRRSGPDRVIITDLAGAVADAEMYSDRSFFANAAYEKETSHCVINAASIATYGRWETKTEFAFPQNVATALKSADVRTGTVWTIKQELRGESRWLTKWQAGDLVLRNNARLGLTESDERIDAVLFEISTSTDRLLAVQIRWGDDVARVTERMAQNSPASGRGGGRSGSQKTPWATLATDVAASSAAGTADEYSRGNHAHKFRIAVGGETVTPSSGEIEFTGAGVSKTGAHQLTFAAGMVAHDIVGAFHTVTASALQLVGATAANTIGLLTPTTTGAANSIVATDANSYVTATRFQVATADHFADVSGGNLRLQSSGDIHLRTGGAARYWFGDTRFLPAANLSITLGNAGYRWLTIFGGDIDISTAKGIIHADGNQAGRILVANGTRYVPGTGGSITAPGANTQVIYNDGGVFGADANFTWNKGTRVLTVK